MITVFHGNNEVASRQAFRKEVDAKKAQDKIEEYRYDGKKISYAEAIEATQETSLFGAGRVISIEGLLKRPVSTEKKEIVTYLNSLSTDSLAIYLWESQLLTPAQKKQLSQANFKEFKVSSSIFLFVESFKPGNSVNSFKLFKKAVEEESAEFVFTMLIRQVRMMLQVADGGILTGAPWMVTKIKAQAQSFNENSLLKLYSQLCTIDSDIKSGKTIKPLDCYLDLIIVKL